jgi:tRNA/rRNA methyltransferase
VIGTTARDGAYRDRTRDVRELMELAVDVTLDTVPDPPRPVAIVFGPEDTGLTNEDIAACHHLASIPTSDDYTSLNLAQATMVTLYEFRRSYLARAFDGPLRFGRRQSADAAEIEAMFVQLQNALLEIGFLAHDNPEHMMATVRAMISRAGLNTREVAVLRGLARQVGWYAAGGFEVVAEKRRSGKKLR